MGYIIWPWRLYRAILTTGPSYLTKCTLCSVKSTYEGVSANPSYLDGVQGPWRLKYPNDMAGKELITKLTEVVPNTLF